MKYKKNFFFFVIILVISFLYFPQTVKADYFNIIYFETDKEFYYIDESILINASWQLDYDPENENAYFRVKIFDSEEELLWNSTHLWERGTFQKQWLINILSLDIDLNKSINILTVRFFYFFLDIGHGGGYEGDQEIIEIHIGKRNVSCILNAFKEFLNYEENSEFIARIFYTSNSIPLINQSVYVSVLSNENLLFNHTYITNSTGEIEIFISGTENLTIGMHKLIITLLNSDFFNNSVFEHFLYISEKSISFSSNKSNKNNSKTALIDNFYLIPILSSISVIPSIAYIKFIKKKKKKPLKDLVIQY